MVDSSSGVDRALAEKWGVSVVPMYVTWEGETYREGVDLFPTDFYQRLTERDENPKTSAPNPADFTAAYARHADEGYRHVVVVTPSRSLTGVAQSALLGARDVSGIGITVVDSRQGAGSQALVAFHAARAARDGGTAATVVTAAEYAIASVEVWMCLDTLRYLRRSGRISATQAIAGDAIGMKPIVSFVDGALTLVDRPRTRSRATARLLGLLDKAAGGVRHILVMYTDDPHDGHELSSLLRRRFPDDRVVIDSAALSAVVGGNCGIGTRGVAALRA
jgi:DegV family protein with EDD domain